MDKRAVTPVLPEGHDLARWTAEEIEAVGSVGDAYDNAAAETVMGLFKNEAIAKNSPFRAGPLKTIADVEEIVFHWVTWYNNDRLHSYLGNIPPEECERNYYAQRHGASTGDAANKNGGMKTGMLQFRFNN